MYQFTVFSDGDDYNRRDKAISGMRPAKQGFNTNDVTLTIMLGLIDQCQRVLSNSILHINSKIPGNHANFILSGDNFLFSVSYLDNRIGGQLECFHGMLVTFFFGFPDKGDITHSAECD